MPTLINRTRRSKFNAHNMLDQLSSAYTHSLPETVLVEVIANALDADAAQIDIEVDPAKCTLTVADNGSGMTEDEFTSYHDWADSPKIRGVGIGFAGIGAKLAHKLADSVHTDTRSQDFKSGTYLVSSAMAQSQPIPRICPVSADLVA